ncbi:Oxidoreductase molybdopterin binding domain protein [Pelotomaculum schinkii]|uniref:Oxidoreductase molybdopterin binding domain protein n=1 Tax=Pelotomaculum schinkii TaxID=78350 RepID=A0A4Y7RGX1_9FIRM|nr:MULTISPECIES: molybdopterin-dependent oxidoreductase [Pelotomaculum]TEB08066.1 Oxidoreductase molybdopterin binding domain protein [Pelotomaculum schinkii]TEB15758.1 Oxidoreductase molybdopterin binding domain protein [Pelotomaculum sp. FP]
MESKAVDQKKILYAVIALLVIIIVVFAFLNRGDENLQEGQILVKTGDNVIGVLTVADLQKLPAAQKKMVIQSTSGMTKHEFTGAPLLDALNSIDPGLSQKCTRIITRGIDNYTSGVNMSEVLRPNNVFIVYADHGEPLKTKTGGEGAMRIIIYQDEFGQRFTNFLTSLELQ